MGLKDKVLITAGLPYPNGDAHVGHAAGCYLPADIVNRFLKMCGKDTLYICGSDDHGVAIVLKGIKEGKKPKEIVDHFHARHLKAYEALQIKFDAFGSTSGNPLHKELSSEFFLRLFEKGYFSKESTSQFYDEEEKIFLPDRYVKGDCSFCGQEDQHGDQCENCGKMLDADSLKNPKSELTGKPVGRKDSVHWFLDLSKAQDVVETWLEKSQLRSGTRKYVQSLLKAGLVKRCMTRDLDWGLPVPLDDPDADGKVMYVWFDAPIGYISNTKQLLMNRGEGSDAYKNWWSSEDADIFHFIGEDNTIFHCIIWIAMLSVHGGYHLPAGVIVNNFLNIKKGSDIQKISKSKGNALWILDYIEKEMDPDYLRFYLTRTAPESQRSSFDLEEFQALCNSELADTLGNFLNRSLSFSIKFLGPEMPAYDKNLLDDRDQAHLALMSTTMKDMEGAFSDFSTKRAQEVLIDFARSCNKYFNDCAPWSTRKTDIERTKVTLGVSLQSIFFIGVLLKPFLPSKAESILKAFGEDANKLEWQDALRFPKAGSAVEKLPILFQKIEM